MRLTGLVHVQKEITLMMRLGKFHRCLEQSLHHQQGDACCTVQNVTLEGDTVVITTDAVIVGSGAGGGVTAALLAEAGAQASTEASSHCWQSAQHHVSHFCVHTGIAKVALPLASIIIRML